MKTENFCLVEKWRKIERPLVGGSKVLKVWQAWGEDKSEVKLVVKRGVAEQSAGEPGDTPSREVKRRRSRMVKKLDRVDTVHPKTLLDDKAMCRDSIQKLMRIIIAQGNTISTQLAGLREKEEAIDTFEEKMHNLRMQEAGCDYLLSTYLDQLPHNDQHLQVSPRTSRRNSSRTKSSGQRAPASSHPHPPAGVQPQEVKLWTEALDKLTRVNGDLTSKV